MFQLIKILSAENNKKEEKTSLCVIMRPYAHTYINLSNISVLVFQLIKILSAENNKKEEKTSLEPTFSILDIMRQYALSCATVNHAARG